MPTQALRILLLVAFGLTFFATNTPYALPYNGLDGSWHCAQAMAFDKGLIFGDTYTFTYGPLAFLNTHVLPGKVSVWWMVLFHSFVLYNYLEIILLGFKKYPKHAFSIGLLAILLISPWGFFADTTFTLFFLLLFWLLVIHENYSLKAIVNIIVLALLIFFIKQNLSLISLGIILLSLIYFSIIRKVKFSLVPIVLIMLALLIFGFAQLLNVDVFKYVASGIQFVSGYPEASSDIQISKHEIIFFGTLEGLILLLALCTVWISKKNFFKNLYLYILLAMAFFLSFKQSHLAIGYLNIFGFFLLIPALMCLIQLFQATPNTRFGQRMLVAILVIQFIATQNLRFQMGGSSFENYLFTYKGQLPLDGPTIASRNPINYFAKAIRYKHEMYIQNQTELEIAKIEKRILDKIGNRTIDLIPNDISYLYFNKLNYNPRPTPQSYAQMTAHLMQRNGEAYEKSSRPQVVLYRSESFRGQNPFWNDTHTLEALLKHYVLTDSTVINKKQFVVFEAKPNTGSIKVQSTQTKVEQFNRPISIDSTQGYTVMKAKFEYTTTGKILRLLLQPPNLHCTVKYSDGTTANYRAITKLLEGGVIVSSRVTNQVETQNFFRKTAHKNKQVQQITFNSPFLWAFKNEIKVILENKMIK